MKRHTKFLVLLIGLAVIAWLLALVFARLAPDKDVETIYEDTPRETIVDQRTRDMDRTATVYPHFLSSVDDCTITEPVPRTIDNVLNTPRATVRALLGGLTEAEQQSGLQSAISPEVQLQRITIVAGNAIVDFSSELDASGSCMVQGIRAQIENSLLALPMVERVTISINGDVETILQP
jgi:spore germination protein GerM